MFRSIEWVKTGSARCFGIINPRKNCSWDTVTVTATRLPAGCPRKHASISRMWNRLTGSPKRQGRNKTENRQHRRSMVFFMWCVVIVIIKTYQHIHLTIKSRTSDCTLLHVLAINRHLQGVKYTGIHNTNTLISYVQY